MIILLLSLLCICIPCHSAQIPVDTFLLKPIIEDMSISPDGKFIAGINNAKKDRQFLMTHELKTGESYYYEPRENGDVYDYAWASDTKLIYNVSIRKMYYLHMGVIDRYMKNNNPFCYSEVGHIVDGIPADSTRAIIRKVISVQTHFF